MYYQLKKRKKRIKVKDPDNLSTISYIKCHNCHNRVVNTNKYEYLYIREEIYILLVTYLLRSYKIFEKEFHAEK